MEWSDAELCSFLDSRGPGRKSKGDLLCHGKLNLTSSYLALPCIALQLIPAKCTPRTHQRNEKIVLLEYHTGLMITVCRPPPLGLAGIHLIPGWFGLGREVLNGTFYSWMV